MSQQDRDDGGPAFPPPPTFRKVIDRDHDDRGYVTEESVQYEPELSCVGMSLRDYLAAKAMTGLIEGYDHEARCKSADRNDRTGFDDCPHRDSDTTYASQLAGEAYIIADAMLAERTKAKRRPAEVTP
jgi:hypothetical protein